MNIRKDEYKCCGSSAGSPRKSRRKKRYWALEFEDQIIKEIAKDFEKNIIRARPTSREEIKKKISACWANHLDASSIIHGLIRRGILKPRRHGLILISPRALTIKDKIEHGDLVVAHKDAWNYLNPNSPGFPFTEIERPLIDDSEGVDEDGGVDP